MASRYQTYFPGEDRSGEILANALGSAMDRYIGLKRQRKQDELAQQDRDRSLTLQNLQLHDQFPGTTLLPGSVKDLTPGSLPNPADNLQINLGEPGQAPTVANPPQFDFSVPGAVTDVNEKTRVTQERLAQSLSHAFLGAQATEAGKAAGNPLAARLTQSTIDRNTAQAEKDRRAPVTTLNTTEGIFRLPSTGGTPEPVTYNGTVLRPSTTQPAPDRSLTLVADPKNPNGPGIYVARADALGQHAPAAASSGKITGLGSGGIVGVGKSIASVNSMHIAHDAMSAFENDPNLRAHYGAAKHFETLLAGQFDAHGMIDEGVMSKALADLGKNDPELANYFQNGFLWALEDANLSGRPSDFRTRLDHFVSSLKPNMPAGALKSMQAGREERLKGYDQMMPALGAVLKGIAGDEAPAATQTTPRVVPNTTRRLTPSDTTVNPWRP